MELVILSSVEHQLNVVTYDEKLQAAMLNFLLGRPGLSVKHVYFEDLSIIWNGDPMIVDKAGAEIVTKDRNFLALALPVSPQSYELAKVMLCVIHNIVERSDGSHDAPGSPVLPLSFDTQMAGSAVKSITVQPGEAAHDSIDMIERELGPGPYELRSIGGATRIRRITARNREHLRSILDLISQQVEPFVVRKRLADTQFITVRFGGDRCGIGFSDDAAGRRNMDAESTGAWANPARLKHLIAQTQLLSKLPPSSFCRIGWVFFGSDVVVSERFTLCHLWGGDRHHVAAMLEEALLTVGVVGLEECHGA